MVVHVKQSMNGHKQAERPPGQKPCIVFRKKSHRKTAGRLFAAIVSVFCCALFYAGFLLAAPTSPAEAPEWVKPPDFSYSPAGKTDPFHPVIQTTPKEPSPEAKPQRTLTPLERVQPSQLKLVGIISPKKRPRQALVELPNGKGYVLKIGVSVGQRQGKVTAITATSVVIQETTTDVFGKKIQQETILKLHPQGEKSNG